MKLSLKLLLVLVVGIALVFSAISVGVFAAEEVKIEFWHGQAGPLGKILEDMVGRFNEEHPGIRMQPVNQGDYDKVFSKLRGGVEAGTLPEVAQVAPLFRVSIVKEENLVIPVQEFMDQEPEYAQEIREKFYEGILEENTFDGVLTSWPFAKSLALMFYNVDMLEEEGLEVPETWAEFREVCEKLSIPGKRWGFAWTPGFTTLFATVLYQHGGSFVEDGKAVFNSEAGVEALKYLSDLVKDDLAIITKGYEWQNDLVQQRVAMTVSTNVSKRYIEMAMEGAPEDKKFELGMAPMPQLEGGRTATIMYGNQVAIFAGASEKETQAAWEFLKWWAEPEQVEEWVNRSNYLPYRSDVDLSKLFEKQPKLRVAVDSMEMGNFIYPRIKEWNRIQNEILAPKLEQALRGYISPQEALDQAVKEANKILNRD